MNYRLLVTFWLLLGYTVALAQPKPASVDLFGSHEPVKMTLTFDFKRYLKDKHKDAYQPGTLRFVFPDSSEVSSEVRLKARGNFRRDYCAFPPIKLNFKKSDFGVAGLDSLDKLKLVAKCRASNTFSQYVIEEYLIYRVYRLLTPLSFRVRLLDMTLVDSRGKRDPMQQYAFLIEDDDDLAARTGNLKMAPPRMSASALDRQQLALMSVFEFMIGNTDWAVYNLHNLELLRDPDPFTEKFYPVPYDFDYSGLVNATYAVPDERLGIKTVRERLYRGYCFSEEELTEVFALFKAQKAAIYELYETFPLLEPYYRRESIRYLDEFYRIIDDPTRVRWKITSVCQKID